MDPQGRIPLRRGSVCGSLLILLGLWGGLAPLVGPYIHFGYTPDKTMHLSSGRLVYSIVPGAVVLLAGLLCVVSRNRGLGAFAGVLAALGGAWFSFGQTFMTVVLKKTIQAGKPILHAGATADGLRANLETLALFTGLGVLVVLIAGVAMGRFSLLAATDIDSDMVYNDYPTPDTASV